MDLLHPDEAGTMASGTASIGGAGTSGGVVLSAILATLLA